jgi:hypothetical protein
LAKYTQLTTEQLLHTLGLPLGLLLKQPLQGFFSRKCPMHSPQFIPQGAIIPWYFNASGILRILFVLTKVSYKTPLLFKYILCFVTTCEDTRGSGWLRIIA